MTPLIIGDSHGVFMARHFGALQVEGAWTKDINQILPVLDAQGQRRADFALLNPSSRFFVRQHTEDGDCIAVSADFAARLAQHNQPATSCFVLLHGNDHNGRFMCQHEQPFDFFCPQLPDRLCLGRQIIPRSVMLRQLQGSVQMVAQKLMAIKAVLPLVKPMFVMPPPPIPGDRQIKAHPEVFNFDRFKLEDEWVRLKIYYAYVEGLLQMCRQLDIPALLPPIAALDERGFLAEPYWQGATHATSAYYGLLIQQLQHIDPIRSPHASVQITA